MMTNEPSTCPSLEQLRALIDGSLVDNVQSDLQAHVNACPTCQQQLENLVAGSESWDAAVGHLRGTDPRPEETVLSDAMRRMKQDQYIESAHVPSSNTNPLDYLAPSDQPGSIGRLGSYEVTEVVGQGGMGVVLKAFDPSLHRVVAVKVLAPYLAHNPQAKKRFVREALAIAAVSHDHVITIHAIDEHAEPPRIVMQFVSGRSLQQKIDAEGSLDLKEILRIGMQTAAGLAAAHAQGLIHRDVKPSNILLENGIQRVKLTDFGLARAVDDASLTQSGAIAGTPQYMAPEQANGDAVDYRADLFSLGSVMYAMCVGHSPFRASTTMGVLKRVCHDPPRPIQELNPDIPDWLCAIVMKLLAKQPEGRYASAKTVAEVLEKCLAHVQQPLIVAKPSAVTTESSDAAADVPVTAGSSFATNASATGSTVEPAAVPNDVYRRTIFFQPVSGRWVLFFMLSGIAVTMGTSRGLDFPELLLVSVAMGLVVGFWGIVVVAVVRFFWAHLYSWLYGGPKPATPELNGADRRMVPPESVAMLAAIGTLSCGGNLLLAAIVAIIVWRIVLYYRKQIPQTPLSSRSEASSDGRSTFSRHSFEAARTSAVRLRESVREMLTVGVARAAGLFDPSAFSRNKLIFTIAWFVAGAVDMICTVLALTTVFPLALLVFPVALHSFVVSHCINAGQNLGFVRNASFLGLIPLSPGALIRIPFSIATLFWLEQPATQQSFEKLAWAETTLGQFTSSQLRFARRVIVTCGWLLAWTLCWDAIAAAVIFFYLIPFGPTECHVVDTVTLSVKGHPESQFRLMSVGVNNAVGLEPASSAYHRNSVQFNSTENARSPLLTVQLGDKLVNQQTVRELFVKDIEVALAALLHQDSPTHAASLLRSLQRLSVFDAFPSVDQLPNADAIARDRLEIVGNVLKRNRRPITEPPPGFVPIASVIDRELFDVDVTWRPSTYYCQFPQWLLFSGSFVAGIGWLIGCWWIIFRRRVRRAVPAEANVAIAS